MKMQCSFPPEAHATALKADLIKYQATAGGTPPISITHLVVMQIAYFVIPGAQQNFSTG
jgi:hypothetical protein